MCLNKNTVIDYEVKRIINNGFFTHHPFKYSSAQLEDYLKILPYILKLPENDYHHCREAIEKTVDKIEFCSSCYLKGLTYLKILTRKKDFEHYKKYKEQYTKKIDSLHTERDFEVEVFEKIREYGIDI